MKMKTKIKDRIMSVVLTLTLAVSVMLTGFFALPTIGATDGGVSGGDLATQTIIARFDPLDEDVEWQGYDPGEIASADGLNLPNLLTGEDTDGKDLTIEGVTWECTAVGSDSNTKTPAFDPDVTDRYDFTAVLSDGYATAEGVNLPVISVFIRGGFMALAGTATTPVNIAIGTVSTGTHSGYTVADEGTSENILYRVLTITGDGHYVITGSNEHIDHNTYGTRYTRLAVAPGLSDVNITLNGATINQLNRSAFQIGDNSTVNLTLTGSNTVKSYVDNAGLWVYRTATLIIGGTGSLTAEAHGYGAGIGGNKQEHCGTVIINSGTVNATNYFHVSTQSAGGAGIGGGYLGNGGTVTISGGTVTAIGGSSNDRSVGGAGIGGGNAGTGGSLTVTGGTVSAFGGARSAGIGGGYNSGGGTVTISGGIVNASGGSGINDGTDAIGGAGIGGGAGGSPVSVNINGGSVTANGGRNNAGIGGNSGTLGSVTISGGTVNATGDIGGAGIGGGVGSAGAAVSISGGVVNAIGGSTAPGIGKGTNNPGVLLGSLTVTGGSLRSVNGAELGGVWSPTATNGQGANVYLVTLTVGNPAVANTAVTAGSIGGISCAQAADASSGVYGIKDVRTDSAGAVYFYLPALPAGNYNPTSLTLNSTQYTGNVSVAANNNNAATLLPAGFVPVTGITLVSNVMDKNASFTLSGTVSPANATNQTIVWSIENAGSTGALLSGANNSVLNATDVGTVIVRATIANGLGVGNYTKDFTITVEDHHLTVTGGTIGTDYTYTGSLLTILTSKAMTVSGSTADHRIVIGSGVTANLTFDGVTIDMTGKAHTPVFIPSGATLGLTLTGSNTLKGSSEYMANYGTAGLGVPSGATLVITAESTGSLSAYGGNFGAGIGGSAGASAGAGGGCGAVNIHGGTVHAQTGTSGAGIGGSREGAGGTVTITGGNVTAIGNSAGYSAGIGGTLNGGSHGTLTITGGSVKRSGHSGYEAQAKNGTGTDVYLVTFTVGNPPFTNTAIINFSNTQYGIHGVKTDGDGKLYFWLPQSAAGVETMTAGSVVYVGGFIPKPDNSEAVTLIKQSDFVLATGITLPTNTINIGRTVNLQAELVPLGATVSTVIWSMTNNGGTGATLSEGGTLIVPPTGSTGTINVTAALKQSPYGTDITATFTITVVNRDLKIDGGVEGTDFTYDTNGVLAILTPTPMTITGTTASDRIVINSGVEAKITFDGVNIDLSGTTSSDITHAPVYLNSNAKLTLTLTGSNKLIGRGTGGFYDTAGLGVPSGAMLTVTAESTGSLEAKGGKSGAGIGGGFVESCGTVIIQGGTIIAGNAESNGAGIGGGVGSSTNGGTVNISGGTVTAFSLDSAGIGGGQSGNGGAVTISGGTVTAYSDYGVAIGRGAGSATTDGSLNVTGEFDYLYSTNTVPSGSTFNATFTGQPAWWNNSIKYIYLESIDDPQTITFPNSTVDKTYSDAAFTITANRSVGSGAVTYESSNTSVATVDATTGTVMIKGAGTATITATAAAVPGTWATASASYDLTVTPKSLTVTEGNYTVTKVYSGTNSAGTGSGSLSISGIAGSDTVTVIPAPQAFSGSNAGNYTVTVSLTLSGADASKYTLANNTIDVPGAITPKAVTITGATHTKVYDGTMAATGVSVTLSGVILADTGNVSASSVTAEYTAPAAGTTTINITAVTLTGTSADNYSVTIPANTITVAGITKKPLTNAMITGTKQATFTINRANPSVTWPTSAEITYGQTLASAVFYGPYSGAGTFAYTVGTTMPAVAQSGTAYQVTFTPDDTTNYNTLTHNVAVTVIKATISDVNQTFEVVKNYAHNYSFDLTKLLPSLPLPLTFGTVMYEVDYVTNTDGVLVTVPSIGTVTSPLTLDVANVTDAGKTATITVFVESSNYFGFDAFITVETTDKFPVTITGVTMDGGTFNGSPRGFTGTPVFTQTAGGDAVSISGYDVLYESTDGGGYNSSTAPTNVGAYKLTISVPSSDAMYTGSQSYTFSITQANVTVKADDKTIKAGAALPAPTVSYLGFFGTDNAANALTTQAVARLNITDSGTAGTSVIDFDVNAVLNTGIGANYTLNHQNGTLTVNPLSTACYVTAVSSPSGAAISGTNITASVGNGTTSVTVDLSVSAGATWKLCSDPTCTNEITDKTMTLDVGANTAYIKVTAEDGTAARTYTITVTRASSGGNNNNGGNNNSGDNNGSNNNGGNNNGGNNNGGNNNGGNNNNGNNNNGGNNNSGDNNGSNNNGGNNNNGNNNNGSNNNSVNNNGSNNNSIRIIESPGTWTGAGSAAWRIDAAYAEFIRLLLGGNVVDPANYTVTDGSTIITLKEGYINTLADGTHTFRADWTDARIDLELTVNRDTARAPKTGGSNPLGWWIALPVAALGGLCVLIWYRRRQTKGTC